LYYQFILIFINLNKLRQNFVEMILFNYIEIKKKYSLFDNKKEYHRNDKNFKFMLCLTKIYLSAHFIILKIIQIMLTKLNEIYLISF
jgi:hypothetical protein